MEPYRPLIDAAVLEIVNLYGKESPLDGVAKQMLVSVLTERIDSSGEQRTVFDWISRTASSLAQVYIGDSDCLFFPDGLRHAPDKS